MLQIETTGVSIADFNKSQNHVPILPFSLDLAHSFLRKVTRYQLVRTLKSCKTVCKDEVRQKVDKNHNIISHGHLVKAGRPAYY